MISNTSIYTVDQKYVLISYRIIRGVLAFCSRHFHVKIWFNKIFRECAFRNLSSWAAYFRDHRIGNNDDWYLYNVITVWPTVLAANIRK